MSTTIIKAVSLVAGEKFTLPPGSTLLGSTDVGALESNCDIPTLEEIQCYVAIIGSNTDNGTSGAAYYEGEQSHLIGYRLSGVTTYFAGANAGGGGYQAGDGTGLFYFLPILTELKTLLPGIINGNSWGVSDGDRGGLNLFLIQTIPSIATNLQLIYLSDAAIDDPSVGNTTATTYIEFATRAAVVALGYNDVPTCPVVTPDPEV